MNIKKQKFWVSGGKRRIGQSLEVARLRKRGRRGRERERKRQHQKEERVAGCLAWFQFLMSGFLCMFIFAIYPLFPEEIK